MKAVVAIPFRGDARILQWTLDGFARQVLPAGVTAEVRVGGDGCAVPPAPAPDSPNLRITTTELPRVGNSHAKNLLLQDAEADVVIFGNADTRPDQDFIAGHIARLQALQNAGSASGVMVLGAAPFEPSTSPTVFDVLKWETPAIFFYCQMTPHTWYDYRQAWTLNLSMWMRDFRAAGGFSTALFPYGYEDLLLAFQTMGPDRKAVYYDDTIRVTHRHPMTFDQYLNREEMLGLMAPVLWRTAPDMFARLFGTGDLKILAEQFATWTQMDAPSHKWTYQRLMEWMPLSATELGEGEHRRRLLMSLYQMHIPLKRLAFRLGFLKGLTLMEDHQHDQRQVAQLWRTYAAP